MFVFVVLVPFSFFFQFSFFVLQDRVLIFDRPQSKLVGANIRFSNELLTMDFSSVSTLCFFQHFAFNWHAWKTYADYAVGVNSPGRCAICVFMYVAREVHCLAFVSSVRVCECVLRRRENTRFAFAINLFFSLSRYRQILHSEAKEFGG